MKTKAVILMIASGLLSAMFVACQTPSVSQMTQPNAIATIRQSNENQDWTAVISEVDEYKSRYPYAADNTEASLMQANAYFMLARYAEAVVAYNDFLIKNPNDSNSQFVLYRIARCYDLESPNTNDRDQSNAEKAIESYRNAIKTDPTAQWVAEAEKRISILTRQVAEHRVFVARFYWHQGLYEAALSRYLEVLQKDSHFADLKREALEYSADCYDKLAAVLAETPSSDAYAHLRGETPQTLREKANLLRNQL